MLKKTISLLSGIIFMASCQAESGNNPATFPNGNEEFYNWMFEEHQSLRTTESYQSALNKIWYKPIAVSDSKDIINSVNNCTLLIENYKTLSEAQPNQYVSFQLRKAMCRSLEILANAKNSKHSFLPKKIVSADSHNILPKEFIPVYSNSQFEEISAMPESARWATGIKVDSTEDLDLDTFIFHQSDQAQILTELGRADFNNDGIEDALLYLRTKVNGGSHETNKIFLVTAGEDGLVKTLSVFPED